MGQGQLVSQPAFTSRLRAAGWRVEGKGAKEGTEGGRGRRGRVEQVDKK